MIILTNKKYEELLECIYNLVKEEIDEKLENFETKLLDKVDIIMDEKCKNNVRKK